MTPGAGRRVPDNPEDGVDAQMRATLRRHAEDAPRTDLTTGALTRARRIRHRRRIVVAAAALGVAAILVPIGSGVLGSDHDADLADRPDDQGAASAGSTTGLGGPPPSTSVVLPDLPSGSSPHVPYLASGRLVHGSGSSDVVPGSVTDPSRAGAPYLVDAVALDDSLVGFRADPGSQSLALYTDEPSALPSSPRSTQPAIDSNGSMAYAVNGVDVEGNPGQVSTIVYAGTTDDPHYAYSQETTVTQVMDAEDGVVLYNAVDADGRRFVGSGDFADGSPAALQRPYPAVVALSAADQGVGLMVGRTIGMNKHCNAMLTTDDASTLWRSCTWRPTEFSPDGSRVYAVRLPVSRAINETAVLDATDGSVIRRFSTDGRFGRATFESDNALDVVTVEDGRAAIVRCSATEGDCELATDPAPARPDNAAVPYQLTANP